MPLVRIKYFTISFLFFQVKNILILYILLIKTNSLCLAVSSINNRIYFSLYNFLIQLDNIEGQNFYFRFYVYVHKIGRARTEL